MSASTYPQKTTNWARLLTLGAVTLAVLAGVVFGVNYVWQKQFGPTTASAADCRLAQQLFDQARTAPSDKAKAEQWEKEIRTIRYNQLKDQGLSTQVGRYVSWNLAKATGEGERPTTKQFAEMKDEAVGHCDGSGVDLTIPAITS